VWRVPRCFQICHQIGNQLETCTINRLSIYSGSPVSRLRCDTLVGEKPQFDSVELLKKLIKLHFWFLSHGAKYRT